MKQKLVVIGNGMAGMRTVDELMQTTPNRYQITVFGAEPHGNYNRIMLTPVLCGSKRINDIMIHDLSWYQAHDITLHCGPGKAVVKIDRFRKQVIAKDGTSAAYDRLLVATGSLPSLPDIQGTDCQGVMGFRDMNDVETMIKTAESKRHAVVLGGGLLGLEAANGLLHRGMRVTVVNRASHLLNRQLDAVAAGFLQKQLQAKGMEFKLGVSIAEIIDDNGRISGIILSDGTRLAADLAVMATGIKANMALAQKAGLLCQHGIIVNDCMQTSDPAIFAVGECVQHRGLTFGLVAPVYEQAKVCANHLSGHGFASYKSLLSATILKVTGIDLFSVGDFEGDNDSEKLVLIDQAQGIYRKIVLKDNQVTGMILYGDTSDNAWYLNLIKQKTDIADIRQRLIFGQVQPAQAA